MSARYFVAFLALCFLTVAADPSCEKLLQPVEDRTQIAGKWIYYGGTFTNKEILGELQSVSSSWIELVVTPDNSDMTLRWGDNVNGTCHFGSAKCTMSGAITKATLHFNSTARVHVGKHLIPCPDCLVWADTMMDGSEEGPLIGKGIVLFTRSGTLDASNFEVFKKQAACLNFQQDMYLSRGTDLCLDVPDAKEEQ